MMSRSTRIAIGAGALALTLSTSACVAGPGSEQPATPRDQPTPAPSETGTVESGYRDGEYTARGWYGSLPSHHDLTVTVQDGTVTEVGITTPAEDPTSLGYQQRFAEALPDAVIGRSIDELDVDRLAGSSGCSEGFMDALAKIKEQAAS